MNAESVIYLSEEKRISYSTKKRIAEHPVVRMVALWFRKEIIELAKLGFPVVVTILFQYSLLFISLIFVGHIPDEEEDSSLNYAAAGLGASFVNVTGLSIAQGFSTAVDTLCSQAYGYKNYKRVGVVLQRGVLIVSLVMFPVWALWLNSETLLILVQQKPCIARLSAFYTQLHCISLPFILLYVILQHYLNAQSVVWQFVVIGLLTNCISVILHAILIFGAGLGYKGAVVALVLSNCLPPIMVIMYVKLRKLHKLTWDGFSWQILDEWIPFLKLALPGMIMNCLEWWSAEVITFIAGGISKVELAATSVWFQIMVIVYMIPIGLGVATSVRVGNALGRGDPTAAKRISFVAVGVALCFAILCSVLLLASKDYIGLLFISGDDEVVKRVSALMYVAAVMILMDFIQVVIAGSLKGSGRQYIGAIMVFISYYVIGLPLGALLALKFNLGALGLWIGMACGNFVHAGVFIIVLIFSKWSKLSEKAIKLAQSKPMFSEEPVQGELESDILECNELGKTEKPDGTLEPKELEYIKEDNALGEAKRMEENNVEFEDGSISTDEDALLSTDTCTQETKVTDLKETFRTIRSNRLKWFLLKGSVLLLGVAMLIAGGISSSFHPYVAPKEYSNCSNLIGENDVHNYSYF